MKLRLYRNSIRFRLSQDEVDNLASRGIVRESTEISADASITYELRSSGLERTRLINNVLVVEIPTQTIQSWASSEEVGIEMLQDRLHVLIEKDFECLDAPADEGVRLFPNPKAKC